MEFPDILRDLADKSAEFLTRRGFTAEDAAKLGMEIADFIRADWGGQKIYIPKAQAYDLAKRDVEIEARWDGTNTLPLCREFGISHSRLLQIIHYVRASRRHDPNQLSFFQKPPAP